jgi:hypothetical protein
MGKRRRRVFVDQAARHYKVAGHSVGGILGQRAQITADGRVEVLRIDVLG